MKKNVISIVLALLVGSVLAIPALQLQYREENINIKEMYVLQTGVFDSFENAKAQQETIKDSIILEDQNQYRVIVGASTNEKNLEKIEKVLESNNISFYKKVISMNKDSDLLYKYSLLLEQTEDKEAILLLNRKTLEKMIEV